MEEGEAAVEEVAEGEVWEVAQAQAGEGVDR